MSSRTRNYSLAVVCSTGIALLALTVGFGAAPDISSGGGPDSARVDDSSVGAQAAGQLSEATSPSLPSNLESSSLEEPSTTEFMGDVCSVVGASVAGRFLLVSSFQCGGFDGCNYINAVLRYNAELDGSGNPGPHYGECAGIHINNIEGPHGMAIHPTRNTLLVVSRTTHTVKEFNLQTGAFLGDLIVPDDEGLWLPQSIVVSPNGQNIWVSSLPDVNNPGKINGILEYDLNGNFLQVLIDGGSLQVPGSGCGLPPGETCLKGAGGMSIGPNDHLYVASMVNHAVIEYDETGAFVGAFDATRLVSPNGLVLGQVGSNEADRLLVTSQVGGSNVGLDEVLRFDLNTRELVSGSQVFYDVGNYEAGPIIAEGPNAVLLDNRFGLNFFQLPDDEIIRWQHTPSPANTGVIPSDRTNYAHYTTAMMIVTLGCSVDEDCFDGNPCTDDICLEDNTCDNVANDENEPDDGLFCNGVEDFCQNGQVVYTMPPPDCSDGLSCTVDSCNENTDQCDHDIRDGNCLIGGTCYADGLLNPASGCQECNADVNQTNWTNLAPGTACGNQNNSECDRPDTCNASGACQPNYEPHRMQCGSDQSTECSRPDECDGAGICSVNHEPNGTQCNDQNPCTSTDSCQIGVCRGTGTPCTDPELPFCRDVGGNAACVECLTNDDCEDSPGSCTSVACQQTNFTCFEFPDDANCDDGVFCNGFEICNGVTGVCGPGPLPCPQGQQCLEATDECVACSTDADCDDDVFCNGVERCVNNSCRAGTPADCSHLNDDCVVGVCNVGQDACVTQASNENGICDDGDPCTLTDRCSGGTCQGSGQMNCADSDVCTDDFCQSGVGCQHSFNTAPCSDGDPCTIDDTCSNGTCVGGSTNNCNDGNPCTNDRCNDVQGCVHTPNSGASCDDGSECTSNDICFGGICFGGQVTNCGDGNPCTNDFCNPASGECFHENNEDPCDDGNPCTDNVCASGLCRSTFNTVPCQDGLFCTTGDACSNGQCVGGGSSPCTSGDFCSEALIDCVECLNPGHCNDDNVCTDDVCSGNGSCIHTNNSVSCDDDSFCNGTETCSGGDCVSSGNPCSPSETCDEVGDRCLECTENAECNDNVFCNGAETCVAGSCRPGSNPCPGQMCDEADNVCADCLADENCDDGAFCNGTETCVGGACQPGSNPCSGQMCDEINNACFECSVDGDCNDGVFCNGTETCVNRSCADGVAPCSGQVCDEAGDRCVECLIDAHCDDGLFCDGTETCVGNACQAGPDPCPGMQCDENNDRCTTCLVEGDCNDNNVCTDDSCNNDGICVYDNNSIGCDDGLLCTTNDTCANGACMGTPRDCPGRQCDPNDGVCKDCLTDENCNDGNDCTIDTCAQPDGTCVHEKVCLYGDIYPAPDGNCNVDLDDINCVLTGFTHMSNCPQGDIFPCAGDDGMITLDDLMAAVQAFEGNAPCSNECP